LILSLERNEFHIKIKNEDSAVAVLAAETGFSKQKIKQVMQRGAVWLTDDRGTHRLRRHTKKLKSLNEIHLYFDPSVIDAKVDDAILIEDEMDFSLWYKPRGMLSQGSKWGDHLAINRWVENNAVPERPAFIVHRLDRYASGLILIAHKKKVAQSLSALFRNRNIDKRYLVMVHGKFPTDKIIYDKNVDNKSACSHTRFIRYDEENDKTLLEVDIKTGRKHQIRLHLSGAGFPVVGDRLYGQSEDNKDLQLTAYKLSFVSPIDKSLKEYVLPEKYWPKLEN